MNEQPEIQYDTYLIENHPDGSSTWGVHVIEPADEATTGAGQRQSKD